MANTPHTRRWAILGVLAIAQLMVVLDVTVVNVALPSAQAALHFGNDQRQWIITAYTLAFGSVLLLGGKIGDLIGRKWTFVGGLVGFALASALGGAAQSFGMLAAGRALQGLSGALLAPAALGLLMTTFTERSERNKAFGIFGAIGALGASVGLLLGGALTELLDWRAVMYVNLLFAAVAVIGAFALLKNDRPTKKPRLDLRGTVAASAGLLALVYGLSHAESSSWTNSLTVGGIVTGVLLLVTFVLLQSRTAEPLLPLRILTDRTRGAAFISTAISSASLFGTFLFLTYYMQQNLGYSPIQTGLAFLPNALALTLMAMFGSARLQARIQPGILVASGMALSAAALLYLTQVGAHASYLTGILPALLVWGIGLGVAFPTNMANATLGVEAGDAGVASAAVNTSQQVGGSIGTALLSTVAASAATSFATAHAGSSDLTAAAHGYATAFGFSAAAFALGAVLALVMYGHKRRVNAPTAPSTERVLEPALGVH